MSWKPASSLFTFLPLATLNTYSNKSLDKVSRLTPSANSPQLKSIQFFLFEYNLELLEILTVGTGLANGVPLPVVNNTSSTCS